MKKKEHIPFYVINEDFTKRTFEKKDVMPYLISCYTETKKDERPKTFDECKEFITRKSSYMYWSRCQYEIMLTPLIIGAEPKKIDVHYQVMNNIDIVTRTFMLNTGIYRKMFQEYFGI